MSVLIKDMKMPEDCDNCPLSFLNTIGILECPFVDHEGYVGYRPGDCPLVEVKEPHGRLVDSEIAVKRAISCLDSFDHVPTSLMEKIADAIRSASVEVEG